MSDAGVKPQLDRICHSLTTRFGPMPSLYVTQSGHRKPWLNRPAAAQVVEEAERSLGFALPPLLKAILLRIGNGGEALLMVGIEPGLRHRSYLETQHYCDLVMAYFTERRYHEEADQSP